MAYHTGVYKKYNYSDKDSLVWQNNDFEVYESSQAIKRLYLIKDGYLISELASGRLSLERNYKNSFDYWIQKAKAKDAKKVKGIKEKIETLKNDIAVIEGIWQ